MTPEQMKRSALVYACAAAFNKGFDLLVKREPTAARTELRRGASLFFHLVEDPLLLEELRRSWEDGRALADIDSDLPVGAREVVRETIFAEMPFVLQLAVELLANAARHCEAVKLKDKLGGKL